MRTGWLVAEATLVWELLLKYVLELALVEYVLLKFDRSHGTYPRGLWVSRLFRLTRPPYCQSYLQCQNFPMYCWVVFWI